VHRLARRRAPERGGFDTREALLDDYDKKTIEYLEWAAGRGF
jgi:hypothetical protein